LRGNAASLGSGCACLPKPGSGRMSAGLGAASSIAAEPWLRPPFGIRKQEVVTGSFRVCVAATRSVCSHQRRRGLHLCLLLATWGLGLSLPDRLRSDRLATASSRRQPGTKDAFTDHFLDHGRSAQRLSAFSQTIQDRPGGDTAPNAPLQDLWAMDVFSI